MKYVWTLCVLVICVLTGYAQSPLTDTRLYAIGNPTLTDIWVDPVKGNDNNSGATRALALKTVQAAWGRTPRGVTFTTTGYRILLTPGTYTAANFPYYVEWRWGTAQFPVIIQAADGRNTVTVTTYLDVYDCRYFYLLDVNFTPDPPSFAVHFGNSDHILLRGGKFDGRNVAGQTVKINNSQYVYVEQCDIGYATGTSLDFVAVRYGQVIGNRIHDGGNWAMFVKGGSAYFLIEGNELFNAARGGFSAGQFTGFEYLDAPWVHYEAYDIKFVNNLIHDTTGCGLAVQGGYNILLAHNTLYRTGSENALIEMLHGNRICSGDTTACALQQARGGWGTASTTATHNLPSRNVFIYNNLIYNPVGVQSRWMHILVRGPQSVIAGSNIPSPATLDQNLQVRGNLIWNGPANHPLGIESSSQGCQPSNPTCNAIQLRADNTINTVEPQLTNPANGEYLPPSGSNVLTAKTYAIPDFTWSDAPTVPIVPAGKLSNAVTRDANNVVRNAVSPPGAFLPPGVTQPAGSGLQYYPLAKPIRLYDTRAPIMGSTPCAYLSQRISNGGTLTRSAHLTCDGVTIPATAKAIVGNATVVNPSSGGYLTLWPDGQTQPPVSNLNYNAGDVMPNGFTVGLSPTGQFSAYSVANTDLIVDITGYYAPPGTGGLYYHPLPKPIRLLDSRAPIPGFTPCAYLSARFQGGTEYARQARVTCDGTTIPSDAAAIVGNATVVNPTSNGFLTLWPDEQTRPPVSNVNYLAGRVVPNNFTLSLGSNGQFRLYSAATTDLIIDVTGYFSPSASDVNGTGLFYVPLGKPIRLYDTRAPIAGFAACEYLSQPLTASGTLTKQARVTCNGETIPMTAAAVVGNATVVQPSGNGFITLWPNGLAQPPVSNLNYVAGQVVPNGFTIKLGADGQFNAFTIASTNLIVDLSGYFAP